MSNTLFIRREYYCNMMVINFYGGLEMKANPLFV